MKTKYCIIFITCRTVREAKAIADSLLKRRLVACANIIDKVNSKFWWRGKINRISETLVILKTKTAHFAMVEKAVKKLHSYEVPEIIALPIMAGSREYCNWIKESTI